MSGKHEKSYLLTAVWYLEIKKEPDKPPRIVTTGQNQYIGFYRSIEEAESQLCERTGFIRKGAYKYVTLRCSKLGRTYRDSALSMVAVYRWNDDIRQYEKMALPDMLYGGDTENDNTESDNEDISLKEA